MMMNNEDVILLGRRAKDETEDFINRNFENQTKGWPKVRIYNYTHKENSNKKYYVEQRRN